VKKNGGSKGKEKEKFYRVVALILGLTIINIGYERFFTVNGLIYELIVFTSLGLCITSILFMNQEMDPLSRRILDIVLFNAVIKLTILGYCFFYDLRCMKDSVTINMLMSHVLVVDILEMGGILIGYGILFGKIKKEMGWWTIVNVIGIGLLLSINKCSSAMNFYADVLVRAICLISIGGGILFCRKWKSRFQIEDFYFYLLFMILCALKNALSIIGITEILKVNFAMCMLLMGKWVLIFCFCYYKCVSCPWSKKNTTFAEVEQLVNLQKEQSEHIVGMSHELKTPVNVIRSALELMLLDEKDEHVSNALCHIKNDCNEIMKVIQNMIDIQKIEGKHVKCHDQVCNLVEVVENVVDAISQECGYDIVFDPLEEEFYQKVDIHIVQKCLILLIDLLVTQNSQCLIRIEMGKYSDTNMGTSIRIYHEGVEALERLSQCLYYARTIDQNESQLLAIQLIENTLALQNISLQYLFMGEKRSIVLRFPFCEEETEGWIDEENVVTLCEQLKARGFVRSL